MFKEMKCDDWSKEDIKTHHNKKHMEILKLKKFNYKFKNSLEGLNSRYKLVGESQGELKDRLIEIIQSERKWKEWRKMHSPSRKSMGHLQVHQCSYTRGPRRTGDTEIGRKSIWRNNAENFNI